MDEAKEASCKLRKAAVQLHDAIASVLEGALLYKSSERESIRLVGRPLDQMVEQLRDIESSITRLVDPPRTSTSCFPGTARVATPHGMRAIAEMRRGDQVLGWDARRSLPVACRVARLVAHRPAEIWAVVITGPPQPVRTTANHRFLTASGWARADRLHPGDLLVHVDESGTATERAVASVHPTACVEAVYNLHTTGPHNFIAEGLVAHNFTYLRMLRTFLHRLFIDPRPSKSAQALLPVAELRRAQ